MKVVLNILGLIVLACVVYFGYWEFQYLRAESDANEFCESVVVGGDISKAIVQAQALESARHGFQDDRTRYLVIFRGPIFNAFYCELTIADGRVASKRAGLFED